MGLISNAELLASLCVAPLKRAGYLSDQLDQLKLVLVNHLVEKALESVGGDAALASGLLLKATSVIEDEPVIPMAKKRKTAQVVAGYVDPSRSDEHCADCSMFLDRIGICTVVEGMIGPHGWCRFFEPRKEGE